MQFARSALTALAAVIMLVSAGCQQAANESATEDSALATPVPPGMVRGTVLETMDSGGYTYVHLDTGEAQYWIAGPPTQVAVGDVVQTVEGMPMPEFTSNSLDRTFDMLFFVNRITNLSAPDAPATVAHPEIQQPVAAEPISIVAIEDGRDIAYTHANKAELAGQSVTLRGKVVKYNEKILGWNFLHIQDGSGDAGDGSNDLTVTSKDVAAVGQTVVVSGTIVLDKDFGAGYAYPVLMEDASVTVEE